MSTFRDYFEPEEDDLVLGPRDRGAWIADWVIFVLATVGLVFSLLSSIQHGLHGPLVAVDLAIGIAMTVSLWWRRRFPVELTALVVLLGPLSSSAGPAGIFLLYTVAAYRRWQAAVIFAVTGLVLLPLEHAVHPQGSLGSDFVGGVIFAGGVVGWGMIRRSRRQTRREQELRSGVEEQLRVEQIRHAERTRIAREMHDVLAHRLSLLSLHAGALEFRPDASPEEVAKAAAVIRASAHQALEDLRAVIGLLRGESPGDPPPPPQPSLSRLPELLEESRAAGMTLDAELGVDLAAVPEGVGRNALRIVQEGLTNARKHAPGARVELRLDGAPGDGLTIDLRNPVPVAAVAGELPGSATGLLGLAERATLSGGRLEHGIDEHGAFRLYAWLPWSA
jgi:signal transduction histidine kinase